MGNERFLALDPPESDYASARYAVLPVPYEGTVSYLAGTGAGPSAVIAASQQVELLDEELLIEFHRAGIATLPAVPAADTPDEQMQRVRAAATQSLRDGKFLLTLGGEHSITAPLVSAACEIHGPLSVLQLDAHADLRDEYEGTKHSHASVMRRVLEKAESICQVGVRSFSPEEFRDCPHLVEEFVTPDDIRNDADWIGRVVERLGEAVYLTVDMDVLDPSIAPGVGTPEPGGLSWWEVTSLLRAVCSQRHIVAADIVETRPIGPNHITEFVAARLACKIIAYTQA